MIFLLVTYTWFRVQMCNVDLLLESLLQCTEKNNVANGVIPGWDKFV
jgi:hypothetical protein